ncbi:unnamed protein product [Adineta ricciae]|uniref:Uncharacterized protein n=1 Tax=Adineta ricciae TaxID=249248 RepID=A0A816FT29_ADIRI|nr:unnamed protein product [Adineta ricciae]
MAESNKKIGGEIDRFEDIFHGRDDDIDENDDQPINFDDYWMNFGKNERIEEAQLKPYEEDDDDEPNLEYPLIVQEVLQRVVAEVAATPKPPSAQQEVEQEQQLSQQFGRLSASGSVQRPTAIENIPRQSSLGMKRPLLTPTTPTTPQAVAAAIPKKLKSIQERVSDNEIPRYLSTNCKLFDRFITPRLEKNHVRIPVESLKATAILKHRLALLDLQLRLWSTYLQSGTAHLQGNKQDVVARSHLVTWPKEVKDSMLDDGYEMTGTESTEHQTCLNYVNEKLKHLNMQNERYQNQLKQQKQSIGVGCNSVIEKAIDEFVEDHSLMFHRLRIDQEIARIEFEYKDRLLEWEFNLENPFQSHVETFKTLTKCHLAKEVLKMEVSLLKQYVVKNYLPDYLRKFQLPKLDAIDTIADPNMRQRLTDRYEKILQRTVSDIMSVQISTAEIQKEQTQKKFDNDMATFKVNQVHGPVYNKLTKVMCDVMHKCFTNQSQHILTVYKLKLRFFGCAPTEMN